MSAAYDNYDYPAYWSKRDYEHQCEVIALNHFLEKIPKISKMADVGCGYGRLTPHYVHRARKIVLADPSRKLLGIVAKRYKKQRLEKNSPKIETVQSRIENLPKKFKSKSFDLVMLVRVMHHIDNPEKAISTAHRLLKNKGFFIIEFANKLHAKALLKNFAKGNFTFPLEIFPSNNNSKKNSNGLPFLNFHPDSVEESLKKCNFRIIDKRSVSNVRSGLLKKHLPLDVLLSIEKCAQRPFSHFSFGPSIFVLAQKQA